MRWKHVKSSESLKGKEKVHILNTFLSWFHQVCCESLNIVSCETRHFATNLTLFPMEPAKSSFFVFCFHPPELLCASHWDFSLTSCWKFFLLHFWISQNHQHKNGMWHNIFRLYVPEEAWRENKIGPKREPWGTPQPKTMLWFSVLTDQEYQNWTQTLIGSY